MTTHSQFFTFIVVNFSEKRKKPCTFEIDESIFANAKFLNFMRKDFTARNRKTSENCNHSQPGHYLGR